jgi:hypothetical protein
MISLTMGYVESFAHIYMIINSNLALMKNEKVEV